MTTTQRNTIFQFFAVLTHTKEEYKRILSKTLNDNIVVVAPAYVKQHENTAFVACNYCICYLF